MFIKKFEDPARFYSEVNNYNIFKQRGFLVPRRFKVDFRSKCIIYMKINGVPAKLSDFDRIVAILAEVQFKVAPFYLRNHSERDVLAKYVEDVSECCLRQGVFSEQLRQLIERSFVPTLFRDAKPENWVVGPDGKIFLVDFDYVVLSGPFQDIAHLLTGIWLNDPEMMDLSPLFRALDYVCNQRPWADTVRCSQFEQERMFLAACLLTLSKKTHSHTARWRHLEELLLSRLKKHLSERTN